jgi:hypothetical protein
MAEIVIHFTIEGGGDAVPVPNGEGNEESKKEDEGVAFKLDEARSIAKRLARTVANNIIGTIGARTGNYVQQEQLQTAVSFATSAISIVTSFVANPYLGLANLAVQGINTGFNIGNQLRGLRWQNRATHELQRRAGYNSNYNR